MCKYTFFQAFVATIMNVDFDKFEIHSIKHFIVYKY